MARWADQFVLRLSLGNEAMTSWQDIATALRKAADQIDAPPYDCPPRLIGRSGVIMDLNGNKVGGWRTE